MTGNDLYEWPAAAALGRVVPKRKLHEHITMTPNARARFSCEVRRITWAYKIAEETVHLSGSAAVPEIQVFVIDAKEADVSDDVFATVDRYIPYPIVFEINRVVDGARSTRMVARHKPVDTAPSRASRYFTTDWSSGDDRVPLPFALDLDGLYTGLLSPLLPLEPLPGESMSVTTGRIEDVRALQREIATLERKMRNEKQLNRQIEIRRVLRERTDALDALTTPTSTKDSTWTS